MFLPSPKKYKIQLVSPFKSCTHLLLHTEASVKSIFNKYVKILIKNDFLNLIRVQKVINKSQMVKTKLLLLFTSLENSSGPFCVQTSDDEYD